MAYNLTNITNSTSLYEIAVSVNNASSGMLFAALLAVIWIAMFSGLKVYETGDAFVVSSFMTAILAGLLFFSGLIGWGIAVLPLIMFIGGLIVGFFK